MRTLLLLSALTLLSCQTAPFVWVDDLPQTQFGEPPAYAISPADQLDIDVFKQSELSVTRTVRPDGKVTLPLVGDIPLAGLTPTDASVVIANKLREAELVLEPKVTVSVQGGGRPSLITVLGEVREPGQYPFAARDTLLQVLGRAGGLTEFASRDSVFVVREGHEPPRIRFSYARLSRGVGKGLSFRLHDGDIVVVE